MKSEFKNTQSWADGTLVDSFKNLAIQFCLEAKGFGYDIVPTYSEFQKYAALPVQKQSEIFESLRSYRDLLLFSHEKGADVNDSRSIVWWAIKDLKLRPPSDLLNRLEEDDFFEIYDPDHIQIFRSFNFFSLTSYSIEDIFSYSWADLYSRPEFITRDMTRVVTEVLSGKGETVTVTDIPLHVVADKFSPGMEWSVIKHKLLATLRAADNRIFVFNVFRVVDRKNGGELSDG